LRCFVFIGASPLGKPKACCDTPSTAPTKKNGAGGKKEKKEGFFHKEKKTTGGKREIFRRGNSCVARPKGGVHLLCLAWGGGKTKKKGGRRWLPPLSTPQAKRKKGGPRRGSPVFRVRLTGKISACRLLVRAGPGKKKGGGGPCLTPLLFKEKRKGRRVKNVFPLTGAIGGGPAVFTEGKGNTPCWLNLLLARRKKINRQTSPAAPAPS